ncbi:MAG: methyl-accepting chemotaxis protein [Lachnospiraceae bacterium]|nr:methyl-accepting chemotaxis protein [Lachnospiraceae bacterium]
MISKWLSNISVRAKLMLMTIPLAVALVFAVVFMAIELHSTEEEVSGVYYDTLYTVNSALVNGDRDFYQSMVGAMQYYDFINGYTGAPPEFAVTQLEGCLDDYNSNKQQVYDRVNEAVNVASKDEELYKNVKSANGMNYADTKSGFDDAMKAWEESFNVKDNTGDWEAFHGTFSTARDYINDMQEITETWAEQEHVALQKQIMAKFLTIALIFAILIVILTVIVVATIRQIRIGLKSATDNLNQLASGDLNVHFPDDSEIGTDDVGTITRSAKLLSDKLNEVMSKSNSMARELTDAGTDLADSASQASQASEQVTDAVTEISKGAVAQAESVESAVGNTDDIGNNIESITGNVSDMDRVASEMKAACDKAMEALEKLIRQSEEVTASVKDIGDTINSTNESAKSISDFTQAITDIATQTNLLSLNASIEAARAGDAGRGFAVVADEIRALADQSSESADKIKNIVEKLLADSASSVSVLEKLNESFGVQAEQLDSTRSNMEIMNGSVLSVKESADSISKQIASLNDAKEGLTGIISDLSAISEENAASTEQTNASMEELNATFTIISESAGKLQGLAADLTDTISYFRV